ncbi:NDC1 family protein [Megaselia abdita]
MASTPELECKKILVYRCLHAVGFSLATQYFLLAVFLLFVNFHPLHPISWISSTVGLVFSFYTWFCSMPLIAATIVYGIFLGNAHLAGRKYYSSRFSWLVAKTPKKAAFFAIHGVLGFLTAWLYSRFLGEDYRNLTFSCFEDSTCINSRFTFITVNGIYAGVYYFVRTFLTKDIEVEFPVIQEKRYIKIRSKLYSNLYNSLFKSLVPTLMFTLFYCIFGGLINERVGSIFGAKTDGELSSLISIFSNIRLILYVWVLSSQILTNMNLINSFFSMLLTEEIQFPIEKSVHVNDGVTTLVEALALDRLPIAKQLAAFDLFRLSNTSVSGRRQQIFSLSSPGNHPHTWNSLSAQCLVVMNVYVDELKNSLTKISNLKNPIPGVQFCADNATLNAQKLLIRQYNQSCSIRRMMMDEPTPAPQPTVSPQENIIETVKKFLEQSIKNALLAVPGLFYLFGEPDGAKTKFLIKNSQEVILVTQGLAGICAISILEDKYGVVQGELSKILKALLNLKTELDKLSNVNINGRKLDKNYFILKSAVKKSLYRICTVFGDYLRDIIEEPEDLRNLLCFVSYQEG